MFALAEGLESIRAGFDDPEVGDLLAILLTSASVAEADLALVALADRVNQRALVRVVNLREGLACLPRTPCDMAVDAETLARVAGMKRKGGDLRLSTGRGLAVVVRAEGNRCIDLMIDVRGERCYWSPASYVEGSITPEAFRAVLKHPELMRAMSDVLLAMGIVINPRFYFSLEDWHLEHASTALEQVQQLF